jgi:hypothetical protein
MGWYTPGGQSVLDDTLDTVKVSQATHDNLNANANVQQGDADVAALNALYVQPGTGASFLTTNANIDGTVGDDTAAPAANSVKGWLNKIIASLGSVVASVTGTVTANQGTAAASSGGWPVKITNGTIDANVLAFNANITAGNLLGVIAGLTAWDGTRFSSVGQDATDRNLNVRVRNGANSMPTMDAEARFGWMKQTVGGAGYYADEDANFVAGDSPVSIDINATLGRNATAGWFVNDGPGNIALEINEGSGLGDGFTTKSGERISFDGWSGGVDTLVITHTGVDSAYRFLFK